MQTVFPRWYAGIGKRMRSSNLTHSGPLPRGSITLPARKRGTDGDTALVNCTGKIIASYNNEDQELDLSVRTYQVVQEGGDWLVCGTR